MLRVQTDESELNARTIFPHAVSAPPFPGGNLNQNLCQYYCRTVIPFICCRWSLGNGSRLWRWFSVRRSFFLGHRSMFLAWNNRFLINQQDNSTFWTAAILLWGAFSDFVRPLQTNRRSWRPSCNVGCRGRDDRHPNLHNSTRISHDSFFFWGCTSGMMWPHDLCYL